MLARKFVWYIVIFIAILLMNSCANKTQKVQQDIKTQIKQNQPNIEFATTQAQSNKWYKEYLSSNAKKLPNKKDALDYEKFAKVYFADLSQVAFKDKLIPTDKLLQSVSFTYFAKELLDEYNFLISQDSKIAPWSEFKSQFSIKDNVISAGFVAQIAEQLNQFENESYTNFNEIVLANNLLLLTKNYSMQSKVSVKTQQITGLNTYQLPQNLRDFLHYKILYMGHFEKFQSNYLLYMMATKFPRNMINATNKILKTNFKSNDIKNMQNYFKFTRFEPTNPLAIQQCKAGSTNYMNKHDCIKYIFLPWIQYLQFTLKQKSEYTFLPIFTDSKLCLFVWEDKFVKYPINKDEFCMILVDELNQLVKMKGKKGNLF